MRGLIELDERLSAVVHRQRLPRLLEYAVQVLASVFNPHNILIVILVVLLIEIKRHTPGLTFCYVAAMVLGLGFSTLLKRVIGRPRPTLKVIEEAGKSTEHRQREKNHSMPSGDSVQAGAFAGIIWLLHGEPRGLLVTAGVMYARIYYGCHYISDTIVGAALGVFTAYVVVTGKRLLE
eukprot:TRINITY_DN2822_c0_g1_i3.p1 TRINITY_DN2822_c0_g1~~TRINITY_DN2822_c0_g1_i3.p1  ORF type:complete len:178 (-),score=20.04 TRINITY_DN2822_c0_g1_i3:142-675(-)